MLNIESISGKCPVQAYGTVDGQPFYFRARWDEWSFAIAEMDGDPVLINSPSDGFYREGKFGSGMDAGYMPPATAREIIERCAVEFSHHTAPAS